MDQQPQFELRHLWQGRTFANQDFKAVRACLLKETEERIAILIDPNFDCLATNTAAGTLICSDPSLAIAETTSTTMSLG